MSGAHTPGPWLDWSTLEWLVEPKRLLMRTEDARLIAAAPELLEALERLLVTLSPLTARESVLPGFADARERASEIIAIAKATPTDTKESGS